MGGGRKSIEPFRPSPYSREKSRLRLPCPARLNTVKDKLINHMICTAHFGSSKSECERYGMHHAQVEASLAGDDPLANTAPSRRWWGYLILILAVGVFVILAEGTHVPFGMHFDG